MFDNILDMLDTNKIPCFYFDGQVSALEDYLEMKPENRKKVEAYIKSGKIDIGPWYTLPDL